MKNNKNNSATLDDLANMVAKGFEAVDKRFDDMSSDLSIVKTDVKKLNDKVDRLDIRVEELHDIVVNIHGAEILDLQKRVKRIEHTIRTQS